MTAAAPASELPAVDEHAVEVDAGSHVVWRALGRALEGAFASPAASRYARLVGCDPAAASGSGPLTAGATVPGFRVTSSEPERELVLHGRHRFSTYALTFRIDEVSEDRCRLRAESRATFPGLHGAAYRALVVGTGGHAVAVRRLLAGVRRAAERHAAT